tara:strand:+ start:304 stop:768 length:465 start_codon:yes stop_codon:yes gene_type:complete
MNYNKSDQFEFTFNFNDSDPFYITYHKPHIDSELLLFLIDIDLDFNQLTGFTVDYIPNKIYDIQYTVEGYDENVSPWKYLGNNKFEDIWEGSEFDSDKMTLIFDVSIDSDRDELHKVESFKVLNLHDCNPEYRKTHMRSCPNCFPGGFRKLKQL